MGLRTPRHFVQTPHHTLPRTLSLAHSSCTREKLTAEEQDQVLRSYFAQKGVMWSKGGNWGNCKGREHVSLDMYV